MFRKRTFLFSGPCRGSLKDCLLRAALFHLWLLGMSTTSAQPSPDMDASGCVDLHDVSLFQNLFGVPDLPPIADCDFYIDGLCDLSDYADLAAVLHGPICDCTVDAECFDLFPCTDDDCYAGACRHLVNCQNQDDSDADCIHDNCTVAGCVPADEPDGSACGPGVGCGGLGYCSIGVCVDGPISCDDNDACTDDRCVLGTCEHSPHCPDDGDPCTVDTCYLVGHVSPQCRHTPISCDDYDGCTDDRCVLGTCEHSPHCPDDGDPCTVDTCYLVGHVSPQCRHTPISCDDGNWCTDDRCDLGICGHSPHCPDDGDPCTLDCWRNSSGTQCRPISLCADSNLCTDDFCDSGTCHYLPHCPDDENPCTIDYCAIVSPGVPTCLVDNELDGTPCGSDNVPCTEQHCIAGQCITIPLNSRCDDQDADPDCIRSDCDPDAGCILAIEPDGSPCDDGIACTVSDYCVEGQCTGGVLFDSACPNQEVCDHDCFQFYCDPTLGCVQGVEPLAAPCVSNFCAINGLFSACNAAGACECQSQQPPDFGCPP